MNNLKKAMNTAISKVAKGVKELDEAVRRLEKKAEDKGYVVNLDTLNTHRLLTTINEAGKKAKCCCGWKYADKNFKWTSEAPTDRKTTCGSCLPALRASLP